MQSSQKQGLGSVGSLWPLGPGASYQPAQREGVSATQDWSWEHCSLRWLWELKTLDRLDRGDFYVPVS